jgi:hypothetical protein
LRKILPIQLGEILGLFEVLWKTLLSYLCEELSVAFIRLADLIINLDYIATVRYSTYSGFGEDKEIPVVNICLMLPEGSLDSETECCLENCNAVEKLEFENDLAIKIWNHFLQSKEVTVLFE